MPIEIRLRIFKDPASAWTHFLGFLAAAVAVPILVGLAAHDRGKALVMTIYGVTLVGLFLASSVYHFFDLGERANRWLRRFDHAAVFLLIGGTYTPPIFLLLGGSWRLAMLSVVGGLSLAGALLKLFWIDAPRALGLGLYLGLGWVVVVPAHLILPQLSPGELFWLVGGGLAYTSGALVYAAEWPDPLPQRFGHHEVWHLLVLVGAMAHYAFTFNLLDRRVPL